MKCKNINFFCKNIFAFKEKKVNAKHKKAKIKQDMIVIVWKEWNNNKKMRE